MANQPASVLFQPLPEGGGQCLACAHQCRIPEGKAGRCGQRTAAHGTLCVPWGIVAGLAVDPMEKKPLYHFYPGETVLSFGTLGCNFHCPFCQNWETSQVGQDPAALGTARACPAERIVQLAVQNGSRAIASTYNEPLISAEWTAEVLGLGQQAGLKGCLVTNGFASPAAWQRLDPVVDAVNVDLKCFRDDGYRRLGGRLEPVLDAIRHWHDAGVWVEVTTLVVPGFNDSDAELRQIAEFLVGVDAGIPWHVSAYFSTYRMPAEPRATTRERLQAAVSIGEQAGLRHVYTGNVGGAGSREDTCCPRCGAVVISRRGYVVDVNTLERGGCPRCGAAVSGRFPGRE